MKVNHIFLRHFMTEDVQEPGLPDTEHFHTYDFYTQFNKYTCPIDPEWQPDIEYEISITPQLSWNDLQLESVIKKDCLNIVWVPMHYPTWKWLDTYYPEAFHDLEVLADPTREEKIAVVWDYNNECQFPGNFTNNESQLEILKDKDFSTFYCSTLSWNRENVLDTIGFRQIIPNYSCLGGISIFPALREDPTLRYGNNKLDKDKNYPIRYFCPNNSFRPNRGMGIVKMHHKGMLDDTEWNMNQFNSWFEMDRFIQTDYLHFKSYVDEYFKLFGILPRTLSRPWDKDFNIDRINQDRGDHSMKYKSWYDAFPPDLMDDVYIYIVNMTTTAKTEEEPINPTKPHYVGDWDEKILKGFLYSKPVFVNGRPGTVKIMEELGFDMLTDCYIQDYDSEQDDIVRIDKMLECAKAFPKPNQDIADRIEHNNRRIRSKSFWWDSQSKLMEVLLDNHC